MPVLDLTILQPHPDNANRMPREFMNKLAHHIRLTGEYPPLIVRPHPAQADRFQILDGHHRAQVLRELGYEHARCEIWDVDDERAALLLLTLNRLHGEDDPQRRGALFARLHQGVGVEELAKLVPDSQPQIRALIELTAAPPPPARAPALSDMPRAVTFFLTAAQCERLYSRLDAVSENRSRALAQLLQLNQEIDT